MFLKAFFFSDEKIFTLDTKINHMNERWFTHDPEDVPIVATTKFPANVHVLGIVFSEDDVMLPHFCSKEEKSQKKM